LPNPLFYLGEQYFSTLLSLEKALRGEELYCDSLTIQSEFKKVKIEELKSLVESNNVDSIALEGLQKQISDNASISENAFTMLCIKKLKNEPQLKEISWSDLDDVAGHKIGIKIYFCFRGENTTISDVQINRSSWNRR